MLEVTVLRSVIRNVSIGYAVLKNHTRAIVTVPPQISESKSVFKNITNYSEEKKLIKLFR